MKKIWLLLLSGTPLLSFSQPNLVPNPSFENYSLCPNNLNQLPRCNNWFNPTGGSPDYYNSCSTSLFADVPQNTYGYQSERTGGNGYVGISLFNLSPDQREYVEVKLTDSLLAGKKYCVTFYVSFADLVELSSSRLGVYLSPDTISGAFANNLPYTPQAENTFNNFIRDSVNWIAISRVYTAAGGEKFLTLGNFHDDAGTDTSRVNPGIYNNSYYYIDDVSLVEMTYDIADAGSDTTICNGTAVTLSAVSCNDCLYQWQASSGTLSNANSAQATAMPTVTTTYVLNMTDTSTGTLCDYSTTDAVTVYVNDCQLPPANIFTPNNDGINETFTIINLPPGSKLIIFSRWGNEVFKSNNYDNKWDGGNLSEGVYYYILTTEKEDVYKGFVTIIR